jgi:hypothetical protein
LIERLTWIENRHSNLGESNIVKDIDAGFIAVGQNWNGRDVTKTQKDVLEFFGFKTPKELFWSYQWTDNPKEETKSGYMKDLKDFQKIFFETVKESVMKFGKFLKLTTKL